MVDDNTPTKRFALAQRINWLALPVFAAGAIDLIWTQRLTGWAILALVVSGLIQVGARILAFRSRRAE